VNKVALQIGGLSLHWYGVLVALGFVAGLWTASRRAPRAGVPSERVADLGPWLIIGGIVGARLWYVVSYWQRDFAGEPLWDIFMIHRGGLVFYGGFIGAFLAGLLFVWKHRIPKWNLADALAPSIPLGHAFGRIGCLINGCCYGRACDLPWALHYDASHSTGGMGVHPTQLYEAGLEIALYLGLAWLFRHRRFDGQVFAAYLLGYGVIRSVVELFRGDYPHYVLGFLTPAHWVSAALLAGGILLWRLQSNRPATGAPPSAPAA